MYKITIEKITSEKKVVEEYQKLREPYDDEKNKDYEDDRQYGYVEVNNMVHIETKVFEQQVEDLDLKKVIEAINN